FGLDGQPLVKVESASGEKFDLKLERKYLLGQFQVKGGWVDPGTKHKLFPLEMLHDSGEVLVYVYEPTIGPNGKLSMPLSPFAGHGPPWEPVRPEEKQLFSKLANVPDKEKWL